MRLWTAMRAIERADEGAMSARWEMGGDLHNVAYGFQYKQSIQTV